MNEEKESLYVLYGVYVTKSFVISLVNLESICGLRESSTSQRLRHTKFLRKKSAQSNAHAESLNNDQCLWRWKNLGSSCRIQAVSGVYIKMGIRLGSCLAQYGENVFGHVSTVQV